MALDGIHHVAMAVEDLDAAIATYERLYGGVVELRDRLDAQGIVGAYVRVGDDLVELLAPTGPDTPVGRFLAKRGPGMHHVAYAVEDVAATLAGLAAAGATLIDEQPRPGLGGHLVAFVHPESQHGVLVEVVAAHD